MEKIYENVKGTSWINIEETKNTPSPVIKFLIYFNRDLCIL
jgi:hypothetical protein